MFQWHRRALGVLVCTQLRADGWGRWIGFLGQGEKDDSQSDLSAFWHMLATSRICSPFVSDKYIDGHNDRRTDCWLGSPRSTLNS